MHRTANSSMRCCSYGDLLAHSREMRRVVKQLAAVASSEVPVLIQGETGTGKKTAAIAIHAHSSRRHGPLLQVNGAALHATNVEQELRSQIHRFLSAASGTKFNTVRSCFHTTALVENVDELSSDAQANLLHILENPTFQELAPHKKNSLNVRVIATTRQDLRHLVSQKAFREDLYFRLSVFPITMPPLRGRRDDIAELFIHFLQAFHGRDLPEIKPEVLDVLRNYSWPGNVRELSNLAQRLALACKRRLISLDCLPDELRGHQPPESESRQHASSSLEESVSQYEIHLIRQALNRADGNKAKAAKLLRLPSSTLKSKIKKYGLQ